MLSLMCLVLVLVQVAQINAGASCQFGDPVLLNECLDTAGRSHACKDLTKHAHYNCKCDLVTESAGCYNKHCPGNRGMNSFVSEQAIYCGAYKYLTFSETTELVTMTSQVLPTVSMSLPFVTASSLSFTFGAYPTLESINITGLPDFPKLGDATSLKVGSVIFIIFNIILVLL
jgi:hypothetical protein